MLRAAGRCGARAVFAQRRYEQATRIIQPRASEGMLNADALSYLESVEAMAKEGEEVNAGVSSVLAAVESDNLDAPVLSSPPLRPAKESDRSASPEELQDAIKIAQMIRAYSVRGHFMCDLDPLGLLKHGVRREGKVPEELDPAYFGFTEADMERTFRVQMHGEIGGIFAKGGAMTLRDLLKRLKEVYCGRIGWEFMHMPAREETRWLRDRLELPEKEDVTPPKAKRQQIYKDLVEGELFENFLQVKYPTKRFGLDGGESLIPGMKAIIERAANHCGVKDVVIGMPHRGRLNVLTNVCGKPLSKILCEFEEKLPDDSFGSGDVKYHLGTVNDITTNGGKTCRVSLVANPSHLEAVNPVVAGKARAKQRYSNDHDGSETVPIMLHGDAAFSGQGIVYETLGLDNLYRYSCGGSIHIVVNNQIGFTTNPQENRSSPYCTDIGKGGNPVFHVNGDDVESVVRVCEMALDYRQKYKNDVIIDLVCYRRHGHNEKDEPMFTQPLMYKSIKGHPSVLTRYEKQLLNEKVITAAEAKEARAHVDARNKDEYKKARDGDDTTDMSDWLESRWDQYKTSSQIASLRQTGVAYDKLMDIGQKLYSLPASFTPHPSLKRVLGRNEKNVASGENIEWGTAEALAFATLLLEGNHVRLSGQDVERGTFSHRHAVIHDYNTNELHCALGKLHPEQAHFEVCNSSLSEYGVLGFELGYSMENPASLVLWEAQFGDFANGAQVIFDQFLSSGEDKWVRQCGLCVLLPHGYDGQGPEHSSARLERFLIMSDEDESGPAYADVPTISEKERQILKSNWQVVYPTTPAQYFHLLRRQVHRNFRKPLIVFVSKAYLRAPNVSSLTEFTEGHEFQWVIDDVAGDLVPKEEVKRVALCSGQIYFKAVEERKKRGITDLAIVRIEQLAPFPFNDLSDLMAQYPNAGAVWLQEEPKNMGAWTHVRPRFKTVANGLGRDAKIQYIGRDSNASPATGHIGIHNAEHEKMMSELFDY